MSGQPLSRRQSKFKAVRPGSPEALRASAASSPNLLLTGSNQAPAAVVQVDADDLVIRTLTQVDKSMASLALIYTRKSNLEVILSVYHQNFTMGYCCSMAGAHIGMDKLLFRYMCHELEPEMYETASVQEHPEMTRRKINKFMGLFVWPIPDYEETNLWYYAKEELNKVERLIMDAKEGFHAELSEFCPLIPDNVLVRKIGRFQSLEKVDQKFFDVWTAIRKEVARLFPFAKSLNEAVFDDFGNLLMKQKNQALANMLQISNMEHKAPPEPSVSQSAASATSKTAESSSTNNSHMDRMSRSLKTGRSAKNLAEHDSASVRFADEDDFKDLFGDEMKDDEMNGVDTVVLEDLKMMLSDDEVMPTEFIAPMSTTKVSWKQISYEYKALLDVCELIKKVVHSIAAVKKKIKAEEENEKKQKSDETVDAKKTQTWKTNSGKNFNLQFQKEYKEMLENLKPHLAALDKLATKTWKIPEELQAEHSKAVSKLIEYRKDYENFNKLQRLKLIAQQVHKHCETKSVEASADL